MNRLRRLRLERGLSSRALAAQVGCSHVTITNLERGVSHGHPRTRYALSQVMGLPIDTLLKPDIAATPGTMPSAASVRVPAKESE